ncbi:hypothetical protein BC792_108106 [Sphingobacterium allocomposti]|uniref:Uncharacterized protein n=1 Tax=Sphingobacterium allocomposti TaxID=415956 RepID=A0A5S5DK78_9SPHI|nr:hypothetical protein BC792_108106 [Sphingobacterium composti Yoo et al. 2007 non Ten et al. 2007]
MMADGGWLMADGRWQMANGKWLLAVKSLSREVKLLADG